ncbi:MAG TPA: rod shape-determining protein MreD [Solirubrobacteraceae bacterium]|jgi:rod shape-determining protein MreD|nr:rod shape-determining protein MreD [Solirubrobacteraceae bacterium]
MSATPARSTLDSATQVGAAWLPGSLLWRVAVLSVVVVFVQIGVVSEVPVFGVSVDLSPLLVAFTGLLCGSLVGAVAGFAVGLLLDLSLVQTLGITSLTFTLIGYGAGRLRELRDPQAALTPLLVGTAAAACAMVGYSLIEFLLGVDAPVSLELLREIVIGVLIDAVLALPMWALVRRCLIGGLSEDPRRRRRRAYTTGGLSPISRTSSRGGRGGGRSTGSGSRSARAKASGSRLLTRASERER